MFGGEWWAEGDYDGWRLYFTNVYLAFNPIGMAREAYMHDGRPARAPRPRPGRARGHRGAPRGHARGRRGRVLPPDDALDVVTIVVETLRARAEAAGNGDVRFSREDYD